MDDPSENGRGSYRAGGSPPPGSLRDHPKRKCRMRPYLIQNLQSERGETESARWIAAQNEAPRVTELQGTELVIQPKANEVYRCGTVTALTLSGIPAEGSVVVIFTSGTTAATLTVPDEIARATPLEAVVLTTTPPRAEVVAAGRL